MSSEQLNCFYDLDKINTIAQRLDAISSDQSLSDELKLQITCDYFEGLSDDDKREFEHYKRMVVNEELRVKNVKCCLPEYKDKVVLLEFVNQQSSYAKMCAFIAMITYMQTRCEEVSEEDKPAIQRFLTKLFNGSSSKYMGTIYDLYYKNNKSKKPDYVPVVDPNVLNDLMPSIDQVHNFINYADANFEQIRGVVSGIMGFKASQEATIHVHGVFDGVNDNKLTKYRIDNADKISPIAELIPVPFGETLLYDRYKCFRSGVVLFNANDPDVELLHNNRVMTDMNTHAMFKKRLSNLEGRMNKKDLLQLKEYRKEIDELRKLPATQRPPKMEQKVAKLKSKIDKLYESNTNDNEVITNVIKIDKGKVSKQTYATQSSS